jgi:hypothetical protein
MSYPGGIIDSQAQSPHPRPLYGLCNCCKLRDIAGPVVLHARSARVSNPSNYRDKIFAVRAFELILLLAAVGIPALLAKAVFNDGRRVLYCLALSRILWPASLSALSLPQTLPWSLAEPTLR